MYLTYDQMREKENYLDAIIGPLSTLFCCEEIVEVNEATGEKRQVTPEENIVHVFEELQEETRFYYAEEFLSPKDESLIQRTLMSLALIAADPSKLSSMLGKIESCTKELYDEYKRVCEARERNKLTLVK